jgi:hypothetical protein
MDPITGGLAVAGLVSNIIGGISAGKTAKKFDQLAGQVPVRERSKLPAQMMAQAQNELNANPFASIQNRQIAANQANMVAAAQRNVVDPSQMLSLVSAYGAQANQDAFKSNEMNQQMRLQKLQDLYNAQRAGQQEDQAMYEGAQTAFNSRTNLLGAAGQTRTSAWQNAGNSLLSASNLYNSASRPTGNLTGAKPAGTP